MIEPAVLRAERTSERTTLGWRHGFWLPVALFLVFAVVLVAAALLWFQTTRAPGDDSIEAGFARDMIVHHDQAVAMALAIRDRTTDPLIKALATDLLLTQQNQIGQMLGWLNAWGLPATGIEPAMAWMRHPMTGPMPGMATPEQLANLERLAGKAADAEFLRLMIRHHQGGIAMAGAALTLSGNSPVRAMATAMVAAQEAEVATMEELLLRP